MRFAAQRAIIYGAGAQGSKNADEGVVEQNLKKVQYTNQQQQKMHGNVVASILDISHIILIICLF